MILYITGSFPEYGDGIGDAAGYLYESMIKHESELMLVTSGHDEIERYVRKQGIDNAILVKNWKMRTIMQIIQFANKQHCSGILIEYPGSGYKKDLSISMLPFFVQVRNLFSENKIKVHLRLHEYSMCRFFRKIATLPLVFFANQIDVPSYTEYLILKRKYKTKKIYKTGIGSNIPVRTIKSGETEREKIRLSFFGGIYPGKGIERLIDIWAELEKKYPNKYEYALLGGFSENVGKCFGEYEVSIKNKLQSVGIKEKCIITGFLDKEDISRELTETDIAILPYEDGLTLRRGSFLAFLEHGIAIITTEGDKEAKELFDNAEGVCMCKTDKEFIEAIEDMSKNYKFYQAGKENQKFAEFFDWDKIALKELEIVHQLR